MEVNSRKLWKAATVTYFISSFWILTDRLMNSTCAVIANDFQSKQNSNPKQDAKCCKSIINIKNVQAKCVRRHSDDHCFQLNSWRMTWLMNWHGPRLLLRPFVCSVGMITGTLISCVLSHEYSIGFTLHIWPLYCEPFTVDQAVCIVMDELATPLQYYCWAEAILYLFNSL